MTFRRCGAAAWLVMASFAACAHATAGTAAPSVIRGPVEYPPSAVSAGEEGTVQVAAKVGINGRAVGAKICKSSGCRDLDAAALRSIAEWSRACDEGRRADRVGGRGARSFSIDPRCKGRIRVASDAIGRGRHGVARLGHPDLGGGFCLVTRAGKAQIGSLALGNGAGVGSHLSGVRGDALVRCKAKPGHRFAWYRSLLLGGAPCALVVVDLRCH